MTTAVVLGVPIECHGSIEIRPLVKYKYNTGGQLFFPCDSGCRGTESATAPDYGRRPAQFAVTILGYESFYVCAKCAKQIREALAEILDLEK